MCDPDTVTTVHDEHEAAEAWRRRQLARETWSVSLLAVLAALASLAAILLG